MSDFANQCFVCGKKIDSTACKINIQFNLPVCDDCHGTDREKAAIDELMEGMAEGFVCGCI